MAIGSLIGAAANVLRLPADYNRDRVHPDPFPLPPPTLPVEPDWKSIMSKGASADYFGHADYDEALKKGVSRQKVLQFLDANPNLLRGKNVKGGGGLYDQISRTGQMAIGPHFGDYTAEGRKDYFGHADYRAARAAGASDLQIQKYLQGNMGQLRGGNVLGGGGLYDMVEAKAKPGRDEWMDFMSRYEQDKADFIKKANERTYSQTQPVRDKPVMNIAAAHYDSRPGGAGFFGRGRKGGGRRLAKSLNIGPLASLAASSLPIAKA
tara:strand:- start:348 stop:1142 length:795 start_codon:yes stop_codon:yes gene_type:complete